MNATAKQVFQHFRSNARRYRREYAKYGAVMAYELSAKPRWIYLSRRWQRAHLAAWKTLD